MLMEYSDYLINKMDDYENYLVIYDNTDLKYRVYAREDLFSAEDKEQIIKTYADALEKAKAEANTTN